MGEITPQDPVEQAVLDAVAATGAAYEVIEIDPALADTAEFCAAYGHPLEASGNCILVASRDEPPAVAACVVLATTRLDVNKRVRKLLGVRRLSFAPAELTRELTGMEIGGVTPFALPDLVPDVGQHDGDPEPPAPGTLPLWIDGRIADLDRIIVGGGSRRLKLLVEPAALLAIGGVYVDDLAVPLPAG